MVEDNGTIAEDTSTEIDPAPAAEAPQAPRRRSRRSASRPAGPPAVFEESAEAPVEADPVEADQAAADEASEDEQPAEDEMQAPDEQPAEDEQAAADEQADDAQQPEGHQPGEAEQQPEGATESGEVEGDAARAAAERDEPAPEATQRRSRRATRGVTTVAFSAPELPQAAGTTAAPVEAPAVALFQPPDETRAVRRRGRPRTAAAEGALDQQESVEEAVEEAPERPGGGRRAASRRPAGESGERPLDEDEGAQAEAEDQSDESNEDLDDTDEDGTPRRRRRRGGRRRRRPGQGGAGQESGEADSSEDEGGSGAQDEDSEESGDEQEPGEGSSGESSGSRRRRRRRRRAGVAEEMEDLSSEEPTNTVVKVREARRPTDEITSVRGSTRIEAKKQRRRDGREAGRRRAPILTEAEFLARRESVNRVMCVREHGDRTQIAVLEDGVLVEHYVNRIESSSMVGNVYLGKVQNVLPSMEAAFVDIGRGRNAVLYAGEVNWEAAGLEGQPKRIELALKSGDPVLVQVTKDPIGHKGARLTSQISLPGRFLVYVPEGSMTGISRKLPDTERARLKGILRDIVPDGAGVIVRTAAEGATEEQLTADVTRLTAQWKDITKKAKSASPPSLLYGEPDLAIKVVRDIFNEDFTTLLVQGESTWQVLKDYIGWVAPDLLGKLERWVEPTELYSAHRIDEQLAKALDRKVWLPSGGSLVIDRTEAMTVVDVNTGKFTGQGGNLEETVTRNNLEAAEEIVRQLRLRDIGGIIVVDFIDMVLESNRDLVLRRLVECLGRDRTKHQVAEVTSLGLVQMTRKRIGQGLLEVFSTTCEACGGRGHLVSSEPVGGDEPAEERGRRGGNDRDRERGGDRGGRRTRPAPANLGGKQTGKTPPPPKFDEHGHLEHEGEHHEGDELHEHEHHEGDELHEHEHHEPEHHEGAEHVEAIGHPDGSVQPEAGSGDERESGDESGSGDEWVEAGNPGDDQQPADGPGSWGPDSQAEAPSPEQAGDAQHGDADTPGEEHSGDEHAGDEHAGDEHPGDEHPGDEHSDEEHPGDEHAGDEHSDEPHHTEAV